MRYPQLLSLIVPCYNEEEVLETFFTILSTVIEQLICECEIIFIDDGSHDQTIKILQDFQQKYHNIQIIELSRNFGKDVALTAGLDFAQGDILIPLDADLQDPPELIPQMIEKWQEGYDVVVATRRSRTGEGFIKKTTANGFYWLIGKLTSVTIPANTGDFRLLDHQVVEAIKQCPERNRFMKGIFSWVGFQQTSIYFDRQARPLGETKWNYWKLWNFALDGIFTMSLIPLKIWSYVGFFISFFAFCYAAFLLLKTIILGVDLPGYASLMVTILFLGGIQLISLGVIGEYLGRTFDEVKQRPLYFVRNHYSGAPPKTQKNEAVGEN